MNATNFITLLTGKRKKSFNPTSIANLSIWLDATDGLYQERTGALATTPAANDGDPVGTWRAKTGGYFTAPTDIARPVLRVSGVKRSIEFNASSNCRLVGGGIGGSRVGQAVTVGTRCDVTSVASNRAMTDFSSSFHSFTPNSNTGFYGWYDGTWRSSPTVTSTGSQTIIWNSGATTIRRNSVVLSSSLTYAPAAGNYDMTVIGSLNNDSIQWAGRVSSLVVYKSQLSVSEMLAIEAYLDTLW